MARNIKMIPSTVPLHAVGPVVTGAKRRVAAYARVSTDRDEQFTSYEAQIDYYTNYIKSRPDWEFVSVYSDEGKTGCNTRKREGFKNMVDDALDGKIDLIVTKSVSRFARNTVDSLTTIRKRKDKGVEAYFEKENIWTFDGKGNLIVNEEQAMVVRRMHWLLDVHYSEDYCRIANKTAQQNLNLLRKFALSLLKLYKVEPDEK